MECGRIAGIGLRSLAELLRNLTLRVAPDDAGLMLTLGLRLHRHRILKRWRNEHVLDLNRNDIDAPGFGPRIDDLLQIHR